MIYGVAAVDSGLSRPLAQLMSAVVFAGASQIAAVNLIEAGAPFVIVVLTAWVINARFVMYSASLTPYLGSYPAGSRWLFAYLLTDQAYAFSMVRFDRGDEIRMRSYYLGAAMLLWCTWQASTALGILVGAAVPPGWSLDFAVPLTFLALLFPSLKDRPTVVAAVVAGTIAVLARGLPLNTGLLVAAGCGLLAGFWVEGKTR